MKFILFFTLIVSLTNANPLRGIHVIPLVPPEECDRIVRLAEETGKWQTERENYYKTTDIQVFNDYKNYVKKNDDNHYDFENHRGFDDKVELDLNFSQYYKKAQDLIREKYFHGKAHVEIKRSFLVKYNASAQRKLEKHRDAYIISFTLALNDPEEYEGGGTRIVDLDTVVKAKKGEVLLFSGRRMHAGVEITKGVRYIMTGWFEVDSDYLGLWEDYSREQRATEGLDSMHIDKFWVNPEDNPLKKVHVVPNFISEAEADRLLKLAKDHGKWRTDREKHLGTTDIQVMAQHDFTGYLNPGDTNPDIEDVIELNIDFDIYFKKAAEYAKEHMFDQSSEITISRAFIMKYNASAQTELKPHRDGVLLSFTLPLNSPDEYEGGGTNIRTHNKTYRGDKGSMIMFCGRRMHSGVAVTKGVRYILSAWYTVKTDLVGVWVKLANVDRQTEGRDLLDKLWIGQQDKPWFFKHKEQISRDLLDHKLVRIEKAFDRRWKWYRDLEREWIDNAKFSTDKSDDALLGENENLYRRNITHRTWHILNNYIAMMNQPSFQNFFQGLIPDRPVDKMLLDATRYTKHDYLTIHNDNMKERLMSMIYHIGVSPDMAPDCGGHFRWYGGVGMEEFAPSFNTLYLFLPNQHSYHGIKAIKCGERYAISGWLYGKDRDKYKATDDEKRIVRLSKN